jgi:hypothetical protein
MRELFVYSLIVLTIIVHTAHADKTSDLQAYPSSEYLVGVSEGPGTVETLIDRAEAQLSKKIFDKVRYVINENEENWLAYNRVREHYGTVIQSAVRSKLKGIQEYYPPTAPDTYFIVYIKRDELKRIYADEAADLRQEINDILHKAQVIENAGDLSDAAKVYLSTYRLYETLKEAELIQLGAEYITPQGAFAKLTDAAAGIAKSGLMMSHGEVIVKVAKIAPQTIIDINDVARVTAYQFQQQSSDWGVKIKTEELTYDGFNVVSPSSIFFLQVLTDKLGWHRSTPMRGFQPLREKREVQLPGVPLQFFGAYWEDGDKITLRTTLRNIITGEFRASAVVQFNENQRRDKDTLLKPNNLEQFDQDWELFNPTEGTLIEEEPRIDEAPQTVETSPEESLVSPKVFASDGLIIEIATDRGTGPVVYTEGEIMTVFARANQEAYIRLIYILADGKRTLLLENYHIDSEMINQSLEIGKFTCTPPFGVEQLHVYAKPEPFPDLAPGETYEEDGYVYLTPTRGFQPFKPQPEGSAHISITTLPK